MDGTTQEPAGNNDGPVPEQKMALDDIELAKEVISDDQSVESEFEVEPSVVTEIPATHGEYDLKLLGEVYHVAKGGDRSSLDSDSDSDSASALRQKSPLGNTLLHIAAWHGNNEVVDLVAQRAPHLLFELNSNDDSVLHVAARAGHISTVEKLLAAYTSQRPEIVKEWKKYMVREGWEDDDDDDDVEFDEIRTLSGLLTMMKKMNKQGNIMLHEAMMSRSSIMGDMIFQVVEDNRLNRTEITDNRGRTLSESCYDLALFNANNAHQSVLYLAVEAGHHKTVDGILDKCPPHVTPKGKSPLVAAIMKRDQGTLSTILKKKQEWIHLMDVHKRLPLHYAASIGYHEGVADLLEKCKSCSIQKDKQGFLPLHLASRGGHVEVVKELLGICPDPTEMLDNSGRNILHIAAKSGKLDVACCILESPEVGERMINQKDKNGDTPLHLATIRWHPKIVYALTWDHRVDLDLVNRRKKTALDIVVDRSAKEYPSLRQRLTWIALKSAGAKRSSTSRRAVSFESTPNASNSKSNEKPPNKEPTKGGGGDSNVVNSEPYKDRVETLIVVSTLIVTASMAACFATPGDWDDGTARNLKRAMFQLFIFCITISLFSSISATLILIWARLGEIHLLAYSLKCAMPLLGVALTTLSLAFLAGVYTTITKLSWLATTFVVISAIFVVIVSLVYVLLFLPSTSTNKAVRYISYYPFIVLASLAENHRFHSF